MALFFAMNIDRYKKLLRRDIAAAVIIKIILIAILLLTFKAYKKSHTADSPPRYHHLMEES